MSRNRKKKSGNKNQRISANKNAVLSPSGLGNGEIPLGRALDAQIQCGPPKPLHPSCPDPQAGVTLLAEPQIVKLTRLTMKHLRQLQGNLDMDYWKTTTRQILSADRPGIQVIPARAGFGKSTWIRAFLLALSELWVTGDPLAEALGGVILVNQKVEDLNDCMDTLEATFPTDANGLVVALQSLTASGKKRGFCLNPDVGGYEDCDRLRCPYAAECPLKELETQAPHAYILGLTQARFYGMRRDGTLDSLLFRETGQGTVPRRFVIFDEKPELMEICELDTQKINSASTALEKLVADNRLRDDRACTLQAGLNFHISRRVQELRRSTRIERAGCTPQDELAGFCSLADQTDAKDNYLHFRESLERRRDLTTKELKDCLSVLDQLYQGPPVLFCKSGGFTLYAIRDGMAELQDRQILIFDATAPVDGDYRQRQDLQWMPSSPPANMGMVTFHLFRHERLNVSKSALKNPRVREAMCRLADEIIARYPGQTFLCSYQQFARFIAENLQENTRAQIKMMPDKSPDCVPYFGGTNGSNAFNDCTNVILLGYPRLEPKTYLARTYATQGEDFRLELERVAEAERWKDRPWKDGLRCLPQVSEYECRHLAASLEQEIYRCALRNPDCESDIHVFLFCPPERVWELLHQRFWGCKMEEYEDLPDCVEAVRARAGIYGGHPTAYAKLAEFLEAWDGAEVKVFDLKKRLGITDSAWKELIKGEKARALLARYGVERRGRGPNATYFIKHRDLCA